MATGLHTDVTVMLITVTHKAVPADSDVTENMDTLFAAEVSTISAFNDFNDFFLY